MDPRKENWRYFQEKYPDASVAYQGFARALHESGPLDEKTRALIKIGMAVASEFDLGLRSHIEKALEAGCTAEEVEHAVVLAGTTAGFPRMMDGLRILREEKTTRGM